MVGAELDSSYWNNRWEKQQTGWHLNEVNPALKSLRDTGAFDGSCNKKVLLPLCGASKDLLWLADQPEVSEVVGVEFAEVGILQFISENTLEFKQVVKDAKNENQSSVFTFYLESNPNVSKISIYQCDILQLGEYFEDGYFDLVFDRASLVAMEPSLKPSYAEVMKKSLGFPNSEEKQYYLLAIQYWPRDGHRGPPFTCYTEDVKEFYGDILSTKKLEILFEKQPMGRSFGEGIEAFETLYKIS